MNTQQKYIVNLTKKSVGNRSSAQDPVAGAIMTLLIHLVGWEGTSPHSLFLVAVLMNPVEILF